MDFFDFQPLFGMFAGLLSVLAFGPYILGILRRQIQPQRSTWVVWAVLASVSVAAQVASGASHALGFSFVQVGATVLVAALSLAYGTARRFSALDFGVLAGAGLGLLLWSITDTPSYALALSISLSALAALPTVLRSYADPGSESLACWGLLLTASLLAVLAVGPADAAMLAYPVYLLLLYTVVFGAILLGRLRPIWRTASVKGFSFP